MDEMLLARAEPPWPLAAVILSMLLCAVLCLLGTPVEPPGWPRSPDGAGYPSDSGVRTMRGCFALVCLVAEACAISGLAYPETPRAAMVERTHYAAGSKLRAGEVPSGGFRQLMFFTKWSWLLLGFYFGCSALGVLPKAAFLAWQIAAPSAVLVSLVVSRVIWPDVLAKHPSMTKQLAKRINLVQHCANTLMVAAELTVAETPLRLEHAPVAPLFGICYVLFGWWWAPRASPRHGAQYLYPFLDTTLGTRRTVIAHVGLVVVLFAIFGLVTGISVVLDAAARAGVPQAVRVLVGLGLALGICRWRD